jgi:UTP--glucose-1-phosphate uridylyltransferase
MARTIERIPFHGLRFEGTRFDCGSKAGFLEANIAFALARDDLRAEVQDIISRYSKA